MGHLFPKASSSTVQFTQQEVTFMVVVTVYCQNMSTNVRQLTQKKLGIISEAIHQSEKPHTSHIRETRQTAVVESFGHKRGEALKYLATI
jgi:hypothetical protein